MPDDPLSTTFAALADPTRRDLLARLAGGEATVNELATPYDMSLQAVSKHLKVLEKAGLITRGRDAQFRPCRFEAAPLDGAIDWISRHRQIWAERFDRLEQHLRTLQPPSPPPPPAASPASPPSASLQTPDNQTPNKRRRDND
jgi:DNA-binding transcriptional ArsR family regulator